MLWITLLVKIRGCSHNSSPPSFFLFTHCQFLWTIPNKWVAAELQHNQFYPLYYRSYFCFLLIKERFSSFCLSSVRWSFSPCSYSSLSLSSLVCSSCPRSCFHFPHSLHPPFFTSLSVSFAPLCLSLSGWVPAVELVGLVAGVTARLSGVASDQGGRRAARTIGAERLRLTAGHLSRAISVGAEARSPLVGPAYCEDQRQSVSTLCSALSFAPFTSLPPTLTLSSPCLCLLPLYLFEFSPDVLLQLSG